ncbi:MAG: F0F1 ATP synthase subunit B [Actinobacteria bacterium]|nr:F0F1 ATP synthase subunit B [Actinomycetota bacterium]
MDPLSGVEPVGANPLLTVSPGLMIWTIVVFLITLWILKKFVFTPVGQALEKRRASIAASIEEAETSRDEAIRLLDEYKAQLAQARREADELREAGRREGERQKTEIVGQAQEQRERIVSDTQTQIDAQAQAAVAGIRDDVVVLALSAAEKVTGKTLSEDDHRKLVEDALAQADLSGLRSA